MKIGFKKIGILFSLLFILLLSLAAVSAEEISDSSVLSLDDNSESINSEYDNDFNLETEIDSSSQESALNDEVSSNLESNDMETDISQSQSSEILSQNNEDNSNVLEISRNGYTVSANDISANEGTNVNIVAKVNKNGNPVSGGYVFFALWTANGNPVGKIVYVNNGQAVLNINLPKASELTSYNWLCKVKYYDNSDYLQADSTFKVQIKKIYSTKVLTNNILGKMGKKVTLYANVYDEDGNSVNVGTVTFTVNGKSYKVAVKYGRASKTITSPFVGIYKVKVAYNGVENYKSSKGSFKLGSDLKIRTLYYKTLHVKKGVKKYYKATLTNFFTSKPLKKFKVKFKVKTNKKWKTYTLKSNKKGIIKWSTKKLSKGTHKIIIKSAYKAFTFKLNAKIIVR